MRDLRELSKQYAEKLKKIKCLAFDVDGILTNGQVTWDGEELGWNRSTNTADGYMLRYLMSAGFTVGVITGGDSLSVHKRFGENLKLSFVHSGNDDKRSHFKKVLELGFKPEEVLFMGDEFIDLPILKVAGFSATVPEASIEIRESVDYITERHGGMGAAREVMDLLRHAHGLVPDVEHFGDEL
tara:strand:- start:32905 stop:33456 length:552 start_codon:yes stop_codon:yes gene_type:complete